MMRIVGLLLTQSLVAASPRVFVKRNPPLFLPREVEEGLAGREHSPLALYRHSMAFNLKESMFQTCCPHLLNDLRSLFFRVGIEVVPQINCGDILILVFDDSLIDGYDGLCGVLLVCF